MIAIRFFDQFPEFGNPQTDLDWEAFGVDPETVAYVPDIAPPEINLAGRTFELDPADTYTIGRGYKGQDGRLCLCSFSLYRKYPLSRVHATISYSKSAKTWEILDGGEVFVDGKLDYKPSLGGVWVDGVRIPHGDARPIGIGSKISLGLPCAKIVGVDPDSDVTVINQVWAPPGWPNLIQRSDSDGEATRCEYQATYSEAAEAIDVKAESEPLPGWAAVAVSLWADISRPPANKNEAAWRAAVLLFVGTLVAVVAIAVLK